MNIKKTGRPSKVKTCPYRKDIDNYINEGKSAYWISKWVTEEKEYPISQSSIRRYIKKDYNIPKKGVETYYNDKESKKNLNHSASEYADNIHEIDQYLDDAKTIFDVSELTPWQLAQFIIQLYREKRELLKYDDNITINIEAGIGEENIFVYTDEEMDMIREWGKKPNDFLENL